MVNMAAREEIEDTLDLRMILTILAIIRGLFQAKDHSLKQTMQKEGGKKSERSNKPKPNGE